jgi:precorrin-6B methylase 1
MYEQRFRFGRYSPERLWAARWHLFEFPEVRNIIHLGGDTVAVLHDGDPHVQDWVELLGEHGFEIEPVTQPGPEMDAA